MLRGLEPKMRKCWTWTLPSRPTTMYVRGLAPMLRKCWTWTSPPPSTMWSGLEKMLRKCLTPHNNIEGRKGGRCKENQCWNCRQKSELLYLPLSMNFLFLYSLCYSELHQRQQSPSVGENRRDCRNCFSFAKKPAVYVQCDGWYLLSFVENIRDSKDYTVVLFISQRGDILEHDVLRSVVCWSVSKDKFCGVTRPLSG